MIAAHGEPNAVPFDVTAGASWLRASAQLSDDRAALVVQLVNTAPGNFSSTVALSVTGFVPGGVVELWTLSVPGDSPWGDQKTDGNTPGDPRRIAPQPSTLWWPAGAASLNITIPAFSFALARVYAQ